MSQKRVKSRKLVYSLLILNAFCVILTFSLYLAFSPLVNSQESTRLSTGPISTTDEAIKIGMPIVDQYIEENNRTITTVEATLRNSTQPYWFIQVEFEGIESRGYHDQSSGYEVSVWADSSEILQHGPIWHNSPSATDENTKNTVARAIEIAIPIAEEYIEENNRTITTMVEASLTNHTDSRPLWQIDVKFEPVKNGDYRDVQHWIDAYTVSIWADTCEIRSHSARGWY